jgi:hypothetical protein
MMMFSSRLLPMFAPLGNALSTLRPQPKSLALSAGLLCASLSASPSEVCAQEVSEPSVQVVQQIAMRYASLNPEVFQSMKSRSRFQALLPQLTVRATKDDDQESRSLVRYGETSGVGQAPQAQDISATTTLGDDLQLYAEARWKLNETIFNYQETAVMRENRYSAKERQKLLQTVTQVYFERKRAIIKLAQLKGADRELALLKVDQMNAELDALTGGWFSQQLSGGN